MPDVTDNREAGRPAQDATLLRETLAALWQAWLQTRCLRRRTDVGALLPPVHADVTSVADPLQILRRVDRIVRIVVFWKFANRCFYRSFAVATLLRRRGVPAGIDFGLRLSGNRRRQCHCWVTIRGTPLGEEADPRTTFTIAAGGWNDAVHYWLADDDQETPTA